MLAEFAVHPQAHFQVGRIGNLIGRDQLRTDRGERVAPLADQPVEVNIAIARGPVSTRVQLASRNIIENHIAGHVIVGIVHGHALGALADHGRDFEFVIDRVGNHRHFDGVTGTDDGVDRLDENARRDFFLYNRHAFAVIDDVRLVIAGQQEDRRGIGHGRFKFDIADGRAACGALRCFGQFGHAGILEREELDN